MEELHKITVAIVALCSIGVAIVFAVLNGLDNPLSIVVLVSVIVLALAGFVVCSKAIDEA